MNSKIRLKDITWGGRIRTVCQGLVWEIASEVAIDTGKSYSGGMLSSTETISLDFLDGGVSHTFGSFDIFSGMHWRPTTRSTSMRTKIPSAVGGANERAG